ncbi:hypothetical protein Tco_1072319, partial [Tanacetum coccineum]
MPGVTNIYNLKEYKESSRCKKLLIRADDWVNRMKRKVFNTKGEGLLRFDELVGLKIGYIYNFCYAGARVTVPVLKFIQELGFEVMGRIKAKLQHYIYGEDGVCKAQGKAVALYCKERIKL